MGNGYLLIRISLLIWTAGSLRVQDGLIRAAWFTAIK
jgi:hypothetical protein